MLAFRKKVSLYVVLIAGLSGGIILIAATLTWFGHRGIRAGILESTNTSIHYLVKVVEQKMADMMSTAEATLELLENSRLASANTFEKRLEALPLLIRALEVNRPADSVYVGYQSGEFFYLRKNSESLRKEWPHLPDGLAYVLLSVHEEDGKSVLRTYAINAQHERRVWEAGQIATRPMVLQSRPWFQRAMKAAGVVATQPYLFHNRNQEDFGITIAKKIDGGRAVFALDILTEEIQKTLVSLKATPRTEIALGDTSDELAAYTNRYQIRAEDIGHDGSITIASLKNDIFNQLIRQETPENRTILMQSQGQDWYGFTAWTAHYYGTPFRIMIAIPSEELLYYANQELKGQFFIIGFFFVAFFFGGFIVAEWIFSPLRQVGRHLHKISRFDFSSEIHLENSFLEMKELGENLNRMSHSLLSFQELIRVLNSVEDEKTFDTVLQLILRILGLKKGSLYLRSEDQLELAAYVGGEPESLVFDLAKIESDMEAVNLYEADLVTPLYDREGALLGVLCVEADQKERLILQTYVKNVAKAASVGIETKRLLAAQKALQNGIMHLIASGIDSKSQHTGGHCKRVPELALMLMDEVCHSKEGVFEKFVMSQQEREEFRVAAWLHDCGKLTTPEYVVDKATKLETLYNRIHEIRTRFEVLHREAKITCLKAVIGGEDKEKAYLACLQEQAALQEDFAFVAQCNLGTEWTSPENKARLEKIAKRTWLRYFDDTQGLAREEWLRYEFTGGKEGGQSLPVSEPLLADKEAHIIHWAGEKPAVEKGNPKNTLGFDMKVPEVLYNRGEVYNLLIERGTLTEEERFKINDHIIQTLIMLSSLPWPDHLRRVPEIASNHHEALHGNGYPRKLKKEAISLPARMVALADVFEALTAPDRPYKDGKTLSEALDILAGMVKREHLDYDLFVLFIQKGIYRRYAEQFVLPDQIDEVDEEAVLQKAMASS